MVAFQSRGFQFPPSFAWQEIYAEEHARAFTVAKSAGFDILRDIYAALETSLKDGGTFRDFQRDLVPILQAKGWWGKQTVINPATGLPELAQLGSTRRLQLIFDANMRVSYAAGHWASFERNKAARPYLRYVHLEGQEHPRLHHQAWHNVCLPVDHPWWDTHATPNGWSCHCTTQSLSARDVEALRSVLKFDPPPEDLQPWTNKVTGETRMIDRGIDPGWDGNPGKAGWRSVLDVPDRLIGAPPDLAAAAGADPSWPGEGFRRAFAEWFDTTARREAASRQLLTVGALAPETMTALAERALTPNSAAIILRQQTSFHLLRPAKDAPIPAAMLRQLPTLLQRPRAVLREIGVGSHRRARQGEVLIYVFDVPGEERLAKLAVQLDYATKGLTGHRRRIGIVANNVLSGSLVSRADLANAGFYELIAGRL
jgi:hypothetical protein